MKKDLLIKIITFLIGIGVSVLSFILFIEMILDVKHPLMVYPYVGTIFLCGFTISMVGLEYHPKKRNYDERSSNT